MRACAYVALLVVAILIAGCGKKEAAAPIDENGKPIAQKLCPVTGDPIDPKIFVDQDGRRIYFCCNACPPVFKKDPAKYLKIVDEQLKNPPAAVTTPAAPAAPTGDVVYTCPMHPEVRESKPGKCPKCGMDLVPMKKDEAARP